MGIRRPPKSISYTERDGKTKKKGSVTKEVHIVERHKHGDFWKVLQAVKFDGSNEPYLRLGYYVKDHGAIDAKYIWGSQTAQIIKKKNFLRLLRKARSKKII